MLDCRAGFEHWTQTEPVKTPRSPPRYSVQASNSNASFNTFLGLAAFVVIVAGMKVSSPILVPILLAIFIATLSAPPLLWLEAKGLPTPLALLVVVSMIFAVGLLLATLVGQSINDFQSQLPFYESRLESLFNATQSTLISLGLEIEFADIASAINPNSVAAAVGGVVNEIGALLANAFLILLMVIFMLFEVSTLSGKLTKITNRPVESIENLFSLKQNLQRYLAIKTAASLVTALLVWVMLKFLGVDFAILWALLAFILNFVPNIGSIIAAVPAVLISLLQINASTALWVALGYLIINFVIGSVIEPRVAGRHLGLSPLIVFMSLIFWGWVLGPVGMFLSVPLTMVVRLVAESGDNLRWLAIILSDRA